MSRAMTFPELRDLLKHIDESHSPIRFTEKRRKVKYVHPNIDMRSGEIFSITLRGYSYEQHFHTQNECRDLPESLFDRCMTFLDTEQS